MTMTLRRQSTCVGKGEDPFDGKFLSDPQREGLNQFKAIFLGTGVLDKTLSTPKRIHAGRKHNDLDDVGKDTHHRTFFEVLGNWSFGDCFKSRAISWALELLTQVCKLPADRICAMYFGGDEKLSLEGNDEARDIGLEFLPVLPFGRKEPLVALTAVLRAPIGRLMGHTRVRLYASVPQKYFKVWWKYPPKGFYKGNTDASYKDGTDLAWVGGIIRDDEAEYVRAYNKEIQAPTSPLAEVKGVSELILYAEEHGFLPIVIETDCKAVKDKAMSKTLHIESIYREMQLLVRKHNVTVFAAYEEVNDIANQLAHLRYNGMHEYKDINEIPLSIQQDVRTRLADEKNNKPYHRLRKSKK
ncbi:uncharacterized protein LOC113316279 isoform X2 [Papaver somniferum]|uniref:uncharacterized protein LOC113316279 isoform X2 n=1 Tax=Papaver somniferum TaxID=3469 RepID=UPI000E704056|nr:uncharacterized protein LOC113316279 isoform X2 [Papaver somniferum]